MKTEFSATVFGDMIKLDGVMPFPDQTRVKLTIEPVESSKDRLAAWKQFESLCDEKPVASGQPFQREELYDRN